MISVYVPNVLVVGSPEKFYAVAGVGRGVRIVGSIAFIGRHNEQDFNITETQTLSLDGKIVGVDVLKKMAGNAAFDYIVFIDYEEYRLVSKYLTDNVVHSNQLIMLDKFLHSVTHFFSSTENETILYRLIATMNVKSLLDVDSYFADGEIFSKPAFASNIRIEGVCAGEYCPIFTNTYDRVYRSTMECRLCHYNAILLGIERSWEDLQRTGMEFADRTDMFILFVRTASELNKHLLNEPVHRDFTAAQFIPCVNGRWYVLKKNKNVDIGVYVCTQVRYLPPPLSNCYKIIHGGRALVNDIGYPGDNTGDNISRLNPFLNEMTVAYWVWKNTHHDIVGLNHFRRFFMTKGEGSLYVKFFVGAESNGMYMCRDTNNFEMTDILNESQIREILDNNDVIINSESVNVTMNHYEMLYKGPNTSISASILNFTRKTLERNYPDYLNCFDRHMRNSSIYGYNMVITYKYIFDAYCQWLFSIILPVMREFFNLVSIDKLDRSQRRFIGYIAENLRAVWFMKQNLRLKELPIVVFTA